MSESFSAAVKEEASQSPPHSRTGRLAMLSALIHTAGTLLVKTEGLRLRVTSEQAGVLTAFERTASLLYGERFLNECSRGGNECAVSGEAAKKLLFDCGILRLDEGGIPMLVPGADGRFLESADGRAGYLKGAFLGSGSISLKSGYHLEIALSNKALARDVAAVFTGFDFAAKTAVRKDKIIVYVKDGEAISDCLALLGASKGVLRLNEMMAVREVNRAVNRSNNCDLANLDRTVNVSTDQAAAIKSLQKCGGLSDLEPRLKETAQARLDSPDATYAELAEALNISKSGVKHRLKKLMELYADRCGG